jgi:hypothetical protein
MQNIILNNGTQLNVKTVVAGEATIQNTIRKVLMFNFRKADYTFDMLEGLFNVKTNTDKIKIYEGESMFLHEGYNIRASMLLQPELISGGDATTPPTYEDIIIITMAQESYLERQMRLLLEAQGV